MKLNEVVLFLITTIIVSSGIIQHNFVLTLFGLLLLVALIVLVQIQKREEKNKEEEKVKNAIRKSKRLVMRIKK